MKITIICSGTMYKLRDFAEKRVIKGRCQEKRNIREPPSDKKLMLTVSSDLINHQGLGTSTTSEV